MSWVNYAPDHPFPIQNLPYGVAVVQGQNHACVALGDNIVDLNVMGSKGLFDKDVAQALQAPTLNCFMELGYDRWTYTRDVLQRLFSTSEGKIRDDSGLKDSILIPQSNVQMVLPAQIGDYTDCYASREHATNLGKMFRPGQPALLENWLYIPVGYHGRASSIVVSGTPITRPYGQQRPKPEEPPVFGPCKGMDFELEMAAWIGKSNPLGTIVSPSEARKTVFGFSLFNDWSARDIQKWEYVPLGPFLGKNFGSTISPWIVTTHALAPFAVEGPKQTEPEPFPYLKQDFPSNYDISLSVSITTDSNETMTVSNSNYKYMYWSPYQQVAHHTVNGCNLNAGDIIASGTLSGPTADSYGSMIELAWQGTNPINFPSGATRKMIQDNDTVTLGGECKGDNYRIGFGPCCGKILPAKDFKF